MMMKMAKATELDIAAAGDAMSVLNDISSGYYPSRDDNDYAPTFFDADNRNHLRKFYDLMKATLNAAPGWPGRVIGGMCYVILYDKNEIVDPEANVLELHPKFKKVEQQRDELLEALHVALPFVEDAEDDECYKPGAVSKALKTIRAAISKATT
jgi:hypothetical protein